MQVSGPRRNPPRSQPPQSLFLPESPAQVPSGCSPLSQTLSGGSAPQVSPSAPRVSSSFLLSPPVSSSFLLSPPSLLVSSTQTPEFPRLPPQSPEFPRLSPSAPRVSSSFSHRSPPESPSAPRVSPLSLPSLLVFLRPRPPSFLVSPPQSPESPRLSPTQTPEFPRLSASVSRVSSSFSHRSPPESPSLSSVSRVSSFFSHRSPPESPRLSHPVPRISESPPSAPASLVSPPRSPLLEVLTPASSPAHPPLLRGVPRLPSALRYPRGCTPTLTSPAPPAGTLARDPLGPPSGSLLPPPPASWTPSRLCLSSLGSGTRGAARGACPPPCCLRL